MALDEALSVSVRDGSSPPVLRLYGWSAPALSLGYFQKTDNVNVAYCRSRRIPVIRRPTGGRAALHHDELTYSFAAENDDGFSGRLMDVYMQIGGAFRLFFEKLGLTCRMTGRPEKGTARAAANPACFRSASTGELSVCGHKLIGSAQKRWPGAFLQQGSIPLSVDHGMMTAIFGRPDEPVRGLSDFIPEPDMARMKELLAVSFEEAFGISLSASLPSPEELLLAARLESERYPDLAAQAGSTDSPCENRR
jgi:lipoate-protein ligase A